MTSWSWTQPICTACASKRYPGRQMVKMIDPIVEICVDCGKNTLSGIYIRVSPKEANFPSLTKD